MRMSSQRVRTHWRMPLISATELVRLLWISRQRKNIVNRALELMKLMHSRFWIAAALLISQSLHADPCCCRHQVSVNNAPLCLCEAANHSDYSSNEFVDAEHGGGLGLPISKTCNCGKSENAAANAESFRNSDRRENSSGWQLPGGTADFYPAIDAFVIQRDLRQSNVNVLAGVRCCTVLCRWLC